MNENLSMRLPDGRVLAYAEYGDPDGIAVLGLHGTPGTRHIFSLGDASARKHGLRLIAPDRAGVGGSDDRPDHSLAGHIEDAVALLDHLGVEKFGVLGFSGGGPYAAEVARQESPRIRALTLVSAHVQGVQPGPGHRILMKLANVSIPVARLVFLAIAIPAVAVPNFSRFLIGPGLDRSDRQALKDREIRRCLTKGIAGVLWSGRATAFEARNFYRERSSSPIASGCTGADLARGGGQGDCAEGRVYLFAHVSRFLFDRYPEGGASVGAGGLRPSAGDFGP